MKAPISISALSVLIVATLLTGCNANPPQTEALTRLMLQGKWQLIEAATVTEATGEKTPFRTFDELAEVWEFRADTLYKSTQSQPLHYVIDKQPDGMFLRFDMGVVEVGFLPLKVVSLTKDMLVLTTEVPSDLNQSMILPHDHYYAYTFKRYADEVGSSSLIAGTWEVTGGTRRYWGAGLTTETMTVERIAQFTHLCWLFDPDKGMVEYDPQNGYLQTDDYRWRKYTLKEVPNGYRLVIEGMFVEDPDMTMEEIFRRWEQNQPVYNSYITVTRLTDRQMEWDFLSGFGGDEGPDEFHLLLRKK
ncbi:MAG: hypothetical protein IJV55_00260 [Paludibacteraceae bacterium]|nr:hypothetical protein [Paludibacteraceae bacterium]